MCRDRGRTHENTWQGFKVILRFLLSDSLDELNKENNMKNKAMEILHKHRNLCYFCTTDPATLKSTHETGPKLKLHCTLEKEN